MKRSEEYLNNPLKFYDIKQNIKSSLGVIICLPNTPKLLQTNLPQWNTWQNDNFDMI